MALGRRSQILHAIVGHLHHVPALHRQQRRVRSQRRRVIFLPSKRAARLGLDHAHFIFFEIEHRKQRLVHVVRALQRTPHRNAALLTPFRDHAVVLDVEVLLRAGTILALHNVRCVRPRGVHIPLLQQETLQNIVRAPHNRVLPLAVFNRQHRLQRLVFDIHRMHSFAQLVLVSVRQQHNRFFAVVHHAVGQDRLIGVDQLNMIFTRNVGRGYDCEFSPVDPPIKTNRPDQPARNRAPNSRAKPHALALNVVQILCAAQQLVDALFSGDGGSNDAGFLARNHGFDCAGSSYGLRHSIHRHAPIAKKHRTIAHRDLRSRLSGNAFSQRES